LKIDKNTTLKIAKLCRLRIEERETEELSSQLSSILDWVEQLNEVNTDNVEPLSNVSTAELPLRKDIENSEDKSKDILINAPEKLENYFVVPKVVE
jgi:aspartyl-tRNA(Asn)/glutamyl-tRNA(Gln) amidotransferase subunit C